VIIILLVLTITVIEKLSSGRTMSKPLHVASEGTAVTLANAASAQRGRPPKAASVSASCGDRQTAVPAGGTDDPPTSGKRMSAYPMQRRGSRKKTLSLNPEEREALENLIEEVIMGGVGEGVIDSDASSSDDDEDAELPSADNPIPGLSTTVTAGDLATPETFVKGGKKFYPGQLKVALKHMHDLPPRFVRKLAKAQQYLDAGGSMYSKPVVTVGRIDEEEETATHSKDDVKQPKSVAVAATPAANMLERDRDKTRVKEHKLKDAKKVIRTLLTDRDQYVDETVNATVVSSQSHAASGDGVYSTPVSVASDQKSPNVAPHHQHDAAPRHFVSDAASVGENTISTNVTRASDVHVQHPSVGVSMSSRVAEYVPKTSDVNYRTSQTSNLSPSRSQPVPAQRFQPPSVGIPQYQLGVPVVHGMKPTPVLSQSPPGTQYWIPQAVVPNSAPGFYGSSPPVVGMSSVPSAYSQLVPYAYSIQSSYPTVQGVHASYSPQYLYSASPPNQGLVGPPYSAATFSQPVSYPLTVLPPEHYVRPSRAMSANFYQNTPPPGYCATQSCHASDQRPMFASDMPPPADGTRKHMVPADYSHNLSALSVQVLAGHQSPSQPVNCTDTRSGHTKPVCNVPAGVNTSHSYETYQKSRPNVMQPSIRHSNGCHSVETGARMTPNSRSHVHHSSPDPASALNSHCPQFSKSAVSVPLADPCCSSAGVSNPNSVPSSSPAADRQTPVAVHPKVSDSGVCTFDLPVARETVSTPNANVDDFDTDVSHTDIGQPKSQPTSLTSPISNTSVLSNSISDESGSGDPNCTGSCETEREVAGCTEETLEPHSSAPVMTQESTTKSLAESLNDLDISGMAVMPSVNEQSGGISVVSSDTSETIGSSCSEHTGDSPSNSGKSLTIIEESRVNTTCAEDRLPSDLPSGFDSTSGAETLNRSSCDESEVQNSTSSPVCCSELLPPVTDRVSDILLDRDATGVMRNDLSSDLVVTLSSSLMSTLVEMFGPPPECDTAYGMQFSSVCLNCMFGMQH